MPAVSSSRKSFSYVDAMMASLRIYVDHYRLFLSLSFVIAAFLVVTTLLNGTGVPVFRGIAFILAPLAFGFGTLFYMALIFAVARCHLNEPISFTAAIQAVFPKFWRAVGAVIVFAVVLSLGTLVLVIPAVYWMTILYFFMYLIVLEDKRLWESFEASAELVKGHFWEVLGAHGLMTVIALAFLMPFGMGMLLIGAPLVFCQTTLYVLGVLLMPFSVGFYYQIHLWLKEKKAVAGHIAVYEKQ